MGLKNNTVYLESNYKVWKKMFESEKNILTKLFAQDNFLIEHIGSTAVDGLSAKPIVDIAVGVNDLDDMTKYMEDLKKMYTIKKNDESDEILLIKENEVETFFLIHVLKVDSERFNNMIKFRDVLINNPDVLGQYEKLKIQLAKLYSNDRKIYTQSKNDFIQNVLKNTNE